MMILRRFRTTAVLCLLVFASTKTTTTTTTAWAFAPAPNTFAASNTATLRTATSLGAATVPPPNSEWDKPLYEPKSTEPVESPNKASWLERNTMKDVMVEPDYFLAITFALLCPLIIWYHPSYMEDGSPSLIGIAGGGFHLLFAALLWVQTRRVRLVFERDGFEFYNIKGYKLDLEKGAYLERKPDNYVSGTRNRWRYKDIINYGFYPSEEFPVICYFKETETPKKQWNKWFAAFDSYGRGQPHFFPGICNVKEIKRQFELRGVKRKPIPSLKDTRAAKK